MVHCMYVHGLVTLAVISAALAHAAGSDYHIGIGELTDTLLPA